MAPLAAFPLIHIHFFLQGPDASTELGMSDLLRSGAPLTLPLLPHQLRARGRGSSAAAGCTPLQQRPSPAGLPEADASPCYSCSDEDGEAEEEESDAVAAAAAAAAAADGMLESPLMQAERISRQFGLNQEQAEVLQCVAGWASIAGGSGGSASKRRGSMGAAAAEVQPPPVCLVHGPFGSGEQVVDAQFGSAKHAVHGSLV